MRWFKLRWPDDDHHVKTHVVPEPLLAVVVLDLRARHGEARVPDPEVVAIDPPEYWVDYGGLLAKDEPEVSVEVDGLRLKMKVHSLPILEQACGRVKFREAGGLTFRKHHMWMSCLVVSAEQEDELHGALAKKSREAEELAARFTVELRERLRRPDIVADIPDPPSRPDPS